MNRKPLNDWRVSRGRMQSHDLGLKLHRPDTETLHVQIFDNEQDCEKAGVRFFMTAEHEPFFRALAEYAASLQSTEDTA